MPLLCLLYNTLPTLGLWMNKDMVSGASVEHVCSALPSSGQSTKLLHCLSLLSSLAWDVYRAEGFRQCPGTGYKTDQTEEACFPILPILHLSLLIPSSSKILFHSCSELRISDPTGRERLCTSHLWEEIIPISWVILR